MTGIDRVELAYLGRFLTDDATLFALVRTRLGFLLLDRAGCTILRDNALAGGDLPPADLLSRLSHRADPLRARAETLARRLAMARVSRAGLPRLLKRLPRGAGYYNIGHANLTGPGLAATKAAGLVLTVMVHDTIPLDHPHFARPGTVASFQRKLMAVASHADRVIHLSHATRAATEACLARLGRVPPGCVAHLGVETPVPDPALVPATLTMSAPYFVALGTIEPRKNHALLLDIWERLPAPRPGLFILGNRGWADPGLFDRLERLPPEGPVRVLSGLADGAVAALIAGAKALLAPSRAEGFGLPPVEAVLLGTSVIASDLAVTREILGNKAVYLPPDDIYSWLETIVEQSRRVTSDQTTCRPLKGLTWADHFNTVLTDGW